MQSIGFFFDDWRGTCSLAPFCPYRFFPLKHGSFCASRFSFRTLGGPEQLRSWKARLSAPFSSVQLADPLVHVFPGISHQSLSPCSPHRIFASQN